MEMSIRAMILDFLPPQKNREVEAAAEMAKTVLSGPPPDKSQSVRRDPAPAPMRSAPYMRGGGRSRVEKAVETIRPEKKKGRERNR